MITLTLDPTELRRQINLVRQVARLPRLQPADRTAMLNLLKLLAQLHNATAATRPEEAALAGSSPATPPH